MRIDIPLPFSYPGILCKMVHFEPDSASNATEKAKRSAVFGSSDA